VTQDYKQAFLIQFGILTFKKTGSMKKTGGTQKCNSESESMYNALSELLGSTISLSQFCTETITIITSNFLNYFSTLFCLCNWVNTNEVVAYSESTNCTVITELWNLWKFLWKTKYEWKIRTKKTGDKEGNNCKYGPINRDYVTHRP